MESIKAAKTFMLVGLGLIAAGSVAAGVIQPKTRQGQIDLAMTSGYLGGFGAASFGVGLAGLLGYAEELAAKVVEEVV